jgi:hypothetical protein
MISGTRRDVQHQEGLKWKSTYVDTVKVVEYVAVIVLE